MDKQFPKMILRPAFYGSLFRKVRGSLYSIFHPVLLITVLTFVCMLYWVSPVFAQVHDSNKREQIQALQQQTSSIHAKAAEMRRKKFEKMHAAQKMAKNIAVNQQYLEEEQRSLQFHQQRLGETKDHLVYLNNRLDVTAINAMRLSRDAALRLRSLYMGERLSMLQMILEANDLSTLLDRMYYKQKIVSQDKALLSNLREKVQELNTLKVALAEQKKLIANHIETIRVKNIEIQHSIEIDKTLRDKYQHDAAFYDKAEADLLAESSSITSQIRALMASRKAAFETVHNSTGIFMWPIIGHINSGFGYRFHPIFHRSIMHTGIDIGGPNGGAVHAADGGQVLWAGWKGGYGKAVMINHGSRNGRNIITLYGHMSALAVSPGQNVSKGQVVGFEGSTGYSTGPHLHFEVRINGVPVNPLGYL